MAPPPPPPAGLSLKQELVALDPHGFELARKKLEEVFPTLDYVATSSAGAFVGEFKPPFWVSPQQLTRALLASRNANELEDLDTLEVLADEATFYDKQWNATWEGKERPSDN